VRNGRKRQASQAEGVDRTPREIHRQIRSDTPPESFFFFFSNADEWSQSHQRRTGAVGIRLYECGRLTSNGEGPCATSLRTRLRVGVFLANECRGRDSPLLTVRPRKVTGLVEPLDRVGDGRRPRRSRADAQSGDKIWSAHRTSAHIWYGIQPLKGNRRQAEDGARSAIKISILK